MIRIVKLSYRPEHRQDFLNVLEIHKEKIIRFPGCHGVEFLNDLEDPNLFFTYSHWEGDADLENYRKSELFEYVWSTVKPWFANRAEAWSVNPIEWTAP